jgi:hypothetical protein
MTMNLAATLAEPRNARRCIPAGPDSRPSLTDRINAGTWSEQRGCD